MPRPTTADSGHLRHTAAHSRALLRPLRPPVQLDPPLPFSSACPRPLARSESFGYSVTSIIGASPAPPLRRTPCPLAPSPPPGWQPLARGTHARRKFCFPDSSLSRCCSTLEFWNFAHLIWLDCVKGVKRAMSWSSYKCMPGQEGRPSRHRRFFVIGS